MELRTTKRKAEADSFVRVYMYYMNCLCVLFSSYYVFIICLRLIFHPVYGFMYVCIVVYVSDIICNNKMKRYLFRTLAASLYILYHTYIYMRYYIDE